MASQQALGYSQIHLFFLSLSLSLSLRLSVEDEMLGNSIMYIGAYCSVQYNQPERPIWETVVEMFPPDSIPLPPSRHEPPPLPAGCAVYSETFFCAFPTFAQSANTGCPKKVESQLSKSNVFPCLLTEHHNELSYLCFNTLHYLVVAHTGWWLRKCLVQSSSSSPLRPPPPKCIVTWIKNSCCNNYFGTHCTSTAGPGQSSRAVLYSQYSVMASQTKNIFFWQVCWFDTSCPTASYKMLLGYFFPWTSLML